MLRFCKQPELNFNFTHQCTVIWVFKFKYQLFNVTISTLPLGRMSAPPFIFPSWYRPLDWKWSHVKLFFSTCGEFYCWVSMSKVRYSCNLIIVSLEWIQFLLVKLHTRIIIRTSSVVLPLLKIILTGFIPYK